MEQIFTVETAILILTNVWMIHAVQMPLAITGLYELDLKLYLSFQNSAVIACHRFVMFPRAILCRWFCKLFACFGIIPSFGYKRLEHTEKHKVHDIRLGRCANTLPFDCTVYTAVI